ncbi:MAG: hypothetical protein RID91_16780 [Azospirillaceae bacterium]
MARLDDKLARIAAGQDRPTDFIIADAKDGDMGFGATAPGPRRDAAGKPTDSFKTLADYVDQIRAIIAQDKVDIMLTSVSTYELLKTAGAYDGTLITPAVRLNDTSDIWGNRTGRYRETASIPFRSARLSEVRRLGVELGLYSMTFNNDAEADVRTLEYFRRFREDIAEHGLDWFLEVFNPNVNEPSDPRETGAFVNDWLVRSLAGLSQRERPRFLKIAYNGARSMEELCAYDPRLIVGILGGSAGTTHDALLLLHEAARHGAKIALFGRKINLAESPLDLITQMRAVVEGSTRPAEAVKAYHDALAKQGIAPARDIEADLAVTDPVLRADGAG